MNANLLSRRCAHLLLATAGFIASRNRIQWLRAMSAEAEYVPDRSVLKWASGCVLATAKMRFMDMVTLKRDVSRPVLTLEVLICFGSLVFAGVQFAWILIRAPSLSSRLNPGMLIIAGILLGVAGGFGIVHGLRQIMQGKSMPASSAVLIVIAAAVFAAAMWVADSSVWSSRELVLLSVLPAIGALHLRYLARPQLVVP